MLYVTRVYPFLIRVFYYFFTQKTQPDFLFLKNLIFCYAARKETKTQITQRGIVNRSYLGKSLMSWVNGVGFHSMWGFSPAKNLLSFCDINKDALDPDDRHRQNGNDSPVNVLLVRPCDPRSIIRTIIDRFSPAAKNRRRPLRLYVLEEQAEVLARHLLLLHVFTDNELPIRQRAALYLEIFGNSLVQKKTEAYIEEAGKSLVDLIYEGKYTGVLKDTINFRHIKERGRDDLYSTFKSWRQSVEFDVDKLRDHRLRSYYGDRYDRCVGDRKSQFMHSCTYTFLLTSFAGTPTRPSPQQQKCLRLGLLLASEEYCKHHSYTAVPGMETYGDCF